MRLLLALVVGTRAAYFFVPEGEEKCFIEQVPPGVMVSAIYKCLDALSGTCTVDFRRDSKMLFQKEVDKKTNNGTVSYHSDTVGGELQICISCKRMKQAWFESHAARNRWQLLVERRVEADVFSSSDDKSVFPMIGPKTEVSDKLSKMEKQLLSVAAKIQMISAENEYEKTLEMKHRSLSELSNAATQWLSVLEISLMFAVFVFQAWTLRNYFRQQKLI
eukprot:GEMP01067314.1.p1 GENE.GEMP01067314.1~~GEMP01067314.1.p1  ORF type:complete len:219 (+),score=37.83 GEMP01067314.1:141-797(+)